MVEWERKTIQFSKELVRLAEEEQERLGLKNFSEVARYIFAEHLGGEFIDSQTEARKGAGRTPKYDHVQIRDKLYRFMQARESYTFTQLSTAMGYNRSMLRRIIQKYPDHFKEEENEEGFIYISKLTRRDKEKRKGRKRKPRVGSVKQVKEHLMENFGKYDILELTHYIYDNLRDNSYENFKKVYYWALDKQVELGEITEERAQGEKDYMDISLNHEGLYEDITEGPALRGTALGQFSQEKFIREYIGRIGQGSSYIESRMEDYIAENELEGIITVNELMVAYYATEEEELRKQNIHGEADKQKKYKEYYQRQVEEES